MTPGTKLGPYEILSPIGAGGMGEVYRACDTKLKRDVALKVLPDAFARDPGRMARFQREAEVLASLDHPNIAPIFGMVEADGVRALALALVEGPTLADQIAKGPIPLDDALSIVKQIIGALEYAHDRGVIHRDLKPANIKITPEGAVKVLDFGLAKVLDEEPQAATGADSPTLTLGHTRAAVILGTAAYMSPEQAVGKPADRRSDIFSFGSVLFEMLTGDRAFKGGSAGETLVAVAKDEPDWSKLPSDMPPAVHRLLRRSLVKDRKQRLQAIGEGRLILEGGADFSLTPDFNPARAAAVSAPLRFAYAAWAAAAIFAVVAAVVSFVYFRQTPPERTLRYTIAPPENSAVSSFAVSPDGRMVAIAAAANGKSQLWLRLLDSLQAQPMPTTEDASFPFWSPDSRYIGFFAQGKLKKVAASGGPAQSLCDVGESRGGTWNRDDVILFSSSGTSPGGLQRVPAAGGVPADAFKTKGVFRYPTFLPDGRHFLYTDIAPDKVGIAPDKVGIYVASLDGKESRRILADRSSAVFAPSAPGSRTGHLLFVRENNLMAVPFDAKRAQATGDVLPVAEDLTLAAGSAGFAPVTASENGVLLYGGGALGPNQLVWYDRAGKVLGPVGAPGFVFTPAISPDEKTVAYSRANAAAGGGLDIWLRDLARATDTRFTTGGVNLAPSWSPKGDRIAFFSNRGANSGGYVLHQKASSGSSRDELLTLPTTTDLTSQWSRDGGLVVYIHTDPKTKHDLWYLTLEAGQEVSTASAKPAPFLQTEFDELHGQLSPDSRWMAYTSDESGVREVYVRPFPPGDGKWKISTAGGDMPRWRGDGKELFYIAADGKMTVVPVLKAAPVPKPQFEVRVPAPLFEAHIFNAGAYGLLMEYDVTADGKRFLVATTGASNPAASPPLTVEVNWNAGLKK